MAERDEKLSLVSNDSTDGQRSMKFCAKFYRVLKSTVGALLALLCAVLFACASVFTALAIENRIPPLQLSFISSLAPLLTVILPVIYYKVELIPDNATDLGLLVLNGIGRALGCIGIVYSFAFVRIGNATTIFAATTPMFSGVGAVIFLHESLQFMDVAGFLFNVGGTILITRPTFIFGDAAVDHSGDEDYTLDATNSHMVAGYLLVAGGSLGYSVVYVVTRGLGDRVSLLTKLLYADVISTFISLLITYIFEEPIWRMNPTVVGYIFGMSLSVTFGEWSRFGSVQFIRTAVATLLADFEVVPAYLLQYTCMSLTPIAFDLIGAAAVIIGACLIYAKTWFDSWNMDSEIPQ
ncbi:solute carrier family 35 member G2-like [Ptychodera flava]|uniref:solute carrier family 35 member G2-like n=1 Tax=Ptychodera flava TaxID=63121 RepID=UPI003969F622